MGVWARTANGDNRITPEIKIKIKDHNLDFDVIFGPPFLCQPFLYSNGTQKASCSQSDRRSHDEMLASTQSSAASTLLPLPIIHCFVECSGLTVLARIYSDTSPPKKTSFLPPLVFSFQRTKRSSRVEKLPNPERKQIVQILDAFLKKRKTKEGIIKTKCQSHCTTVIFNPSLVYSLPAKGRPKFSLLNFHNLLNYQPLLFRNLGRQLFDIFLLLSDLFEGECS